MFHVRFFSLLIKISYSGIYNLDKNLKAALYTIGQPLAVE
jgi:hypothetical protein